RSEFTNLFQLIAEILESEIVLDQLALHLHSLLLIDRLLGFLDKAEDVAHPQNAVGRAIRMEGLQRIEFLADTYKLERLPGDVADRYGTAAARIAIHLGENHSGDAQPFM